MIETERLIIRPWRDGDRAPFAAMGQDAEVRRFLGPLQSRAESDALIDRMIAMEADLGYCLWAIERRADATFLGFCGLNAGPVGTPLEGGLEIGWRLARAYWGQGYAREAALACLDWTWANLAIEGLFSMTVPANTASWGLMERLGMFQLQGRDFDHPGVPDGSPLKRHIVYRIDRPADRPFVNHIG